MKPAYKLQVDGQDVNLSGGQLLNLSLTDNKAFDADQLSVNIADAGNILNLPKHGAKVQLWLGWEVNGVPQLTYKGSFVVDQSGYAINPRELSFTANSANFRAGLATVNSKSYHHKTIGEITATIAKKHQLSLQIPAAAEAIAIEHIDQSNESDGHFLTRLARQHDALLNIKNDTLLWLPNAKGRTATGKTLPTLTFSAADCTAASYSESDRDSEYTGVKARWHNPDTGLNVCELAGNGDNPQRLKRRYPSQNEALRAATAEWQKLQRSKQALSLSLTKGRPEWITESPVKVTGIKPTIDTLTWTTVKVTHQLDTKGYTTGGELEVTA